MASYFDTSADMHCAAKYIGALSDPLNPKNIGACFPGGQAGRSLKITGYHSISLRSKHANPILVWFMCSMYRDLPFAASVSAPPGGELFADADGNMTYVVESVTHSVSLHYNPTLPYIITGTDAPAGRLVAFGGEVDDLTPPLYKGGSITTRMTADHTYITPALINMFEPGAGMVNLSTNEKARFVTTIQEPAEWDYYGNGVSSRAYRYCPSTLNGSAGGTRTRGQPIGLMIIEPANPGEAFFILKTATYIEYVGKAVATSSTDTESYSNVDKIVTGFRNYVNSNNIKYTAGEIRKSILAGLASGAREALAGLLYQNFRPHPSRLEL